jgi:type IV pilus assembly protein PilC
VAVFNYIAINPVDNRTIQGQLEAESLRQAKEMLREQGQIPTQIEEQVKSIEIKDLVGQIPILGGILTDRFGLKDTVLMTRQMVTLLEAGIPLVESLLLLEQQATNRRLKTVLREIRADVVNGNSFSGALNKYRNEFSTLYVNMIKAGEVSGELDRVCARMALLLENMMVLQSKVLHALTYPAVTVVIVLMVVALIMIFVIPQFKQFFSSYGAELPLPTQVLIVASDFTVHYWWAAVIGILGFGYWFNLFRRTFGKHLVDQWILTLPLIGPVLNKMYVSRFVRTLSTLTTSGVSLTEGLATASTTVDNYVLRQAFDKARESIINGGNLSKPLEQTKLFPPMVTKMMAVGEETGPPG